MNKLPPMLWLLWIEAIGLECLVAVNMLTSGARKRWPSLFLFLMLLGVRDVARIANILGGGNAFVDFYVYWIFGIFAELTEAWIIVQIAQDMLGISPKARKMIGRGVAALAAFVCAASIIHAMVLGLSSSKSICEASEQLSNAVAVAWVITLVIVAFFVDHLAEWTGEVRGVALGITLELTADSYIGWLRISNSFSASTLDEIKSLTFLVSLIVWGASIKRRHHQTGNISSLEPSALLALIEQFVISIRRSRIS